MKSMFGFVDRRLFSPIWFIYIVLMSTLWVFVFASGLLINYSFTMVSYELNDKSMCVHV